MFDRLPRSDGVDIHSPRAPTTVLAISEPTVRITFITPDGERSEVRTHSGVSLMHAAVNNDVPGIDAVCNGDCACATCQVLVEEGWANRLDPPSYKERSALHYAWKTSDNSRLSCAVTVTEALDGLVVRVPAHQY